MANRNAPFGFRAYRHAAGGTIRTSRYRIASGLAANIGYGDPVVETGTSAADGTPRVTIATADGGQTGVFAGVWYKDPTTGDVVFSKNWKTGQTTFAAEDAEALVFDDPNIVFIAQMSDGLAAANIGLLADLVIGAPNSLGVSTSAIDSADLAGSAAKILGVVSRPDNALGQYAVVEVMLGNHVRHERTAV